MNKVKQLYTYYTYWFDRIVLPIREYIDMQIGRYRQHMLHHSDIGCCWNTRRYLHDKVISIISSYFWHFGNFRLKATCTKLGNDGQLRTVITNWNKVIHDKVHQSLQITIAHQPFQHFQFKINELTDSTQLSRPSWSALTCKLIDTINACCTI